MTAKTMYKAYLIAFVMIAGFFALGESAAFGAADCLQCHLELTQGKVVHPAMSMGCTFCHIGVDAANIPHAFSNSPKGLVSDIYSDTCFMCHLKSKFSPPTYSNIHAPVALGLCTQCHNPHRSDNPKLLVADIKILCFNCHDKDKFTKKKKVHSPVSKGLCRDCHVPHGNNNEALVMNKGNVLCRKCHPRVEKEPHAVTGFKLGGHPVRGKADPRRKGKTFECLSCHNAHSSDWGAMFRYQADTMYDMCGYCHSV